MINRKWLCLVSCTFDRIMFMTRKKIGTIIIPPGVFVSVHEKMTADYLAMIGNDVIFLKPNRRKGSKTPDIRMSNRLWEIKCPTGKSSRTIENNLRAALSQSANIILDLRRMDGRIPAHKLLSETERQFTLTRSIRWMIVITKDNKHIDFRR